MKQFVLVVLMLLTASCTSGEDFYKPDGTDDEKATDVEYCQTYAEANTVPTTYGGLTAAADIMGRSAAQFKLCMLDRGYKESS